LPPLTKLPRSEESVPLRNIRAQHIGHLIKTRGIVVRTSELMPLVRVATYSCDKCSYEVYQEVSGRNFMPRFTCEGEKCKGGGGTLVMQTRGSKFVKFQELRLQELPEEVSMQLVSPLASLLNLHECFYGLKLQRF